MVRDTSSVELYRDMNDNIQFSSHPQKEPLPQFAIGIESIRSAVRKCWCLGGTESLIQSEHASMAQW